MIIAIVAHNKNYVIGKNNKIPWNLPEDLKLFKKHTEGHVVVMGRKTWESLPEKFRPLPNRLNIVMSRSYKNPEHEPNLVKVGSWDDALLQAQYMSPGKHVFVIGGSEIYDCALNKAKVKASRILLSLVDGEQEGDTYFPKVGGTWIDVDVSSHQGFKLIEKIRYETCIPMDDRQL